MRKIVTLICFALLLTTSCAVVGNVPVSEKKAEAYLCFSAIEDYLVDVNVDSDRNYRVRAIRLRSDDQIVVPRKTVRNTIVVPPGVHTVKVKLKGADLYEQQIEIDAGEIMVIRL